MPEDANRLLEIRDGVGVFRTPDGLALGEIVAQSVGAIDDACRAGIAFVLIDARGLSAPSPTLADRAAITRRWAAAANGRLQLVVVAPAEMIDPERFGVVSAAHHGLSGQVFDDIDDAWAWIAASRGDR